MASFVPSSFVGALPSSSFVVRRPACSRASRLKHAVRRTVRMGVGEDGLVEDMDAAKKCIDEGCEVGAVQEILTRLEQRRAVLTMEVEEINEVMAVLAKENLGGDRSLVAQAMDAAVRIFSRTEDNYPKVGSPSPWTMDKPKKKNPF